MFHPPTVKPSVVPNIFVDDVKIEDLNNATFLGLRINPTLNWGDQVDSVCSKVSKGIFVLGSLRDRVSLKILKLIYHAHVVSHLRNLIIFWGHCSEAKRAFILQKRAIRTIFSLCKTTSCVPFFNNFDVLTLPCIYIAECSMFVKKYPELFNKNSDVHSYSTRSQSNLRVLHTHNKAMFEKCPEYRFTHIFNKLPNAIKDVQNEKLFKCKLINFLKTKNYYSINDFLQP